MNTVGVLKNYRSHSESVAVFFLFFCFFVISEPIRVKEDELSLCMTIVPNPSELLSAST